VMLVSSVADINFGWLAGDDYSPTRRSAPAQSVTGIAIGDDREADTPQYSASRDAFSLAYAGVTSLAVA